MHFLIGHTLIAYEHQHCKLSLYIRFCFLNFVSRSVITVHISRYVLSHKVQITGSIGGELEIVVLPPLSRYNVTVTRYSCIYAKIGKEEKKTGTIYDTYIRLVYKKSENIFRNFHCKLL